MVHQSVEIFYHFKFSLRTALLTKGPSTCAMGLQQYF